MSDFRNYLRAGYPCLYVQTSEEDRAILELTKQADGYSCNMWDIVNGLTDCQRTRKQDMEDPSEAIRSITGLASGSILFVKDAHRFMDDLVFCRTVKNILPICKSTDRHIIFISPILKIAKELEKEVTTYEFGLPTVEELLEVAKALVKDNGLDVPVDLDTIAAAKGLTIAEAENSFARSLVSKKVYDKEILNSEKLQAVKKSGLAEIWLPVPENEVGGLDILKNYIKSRARGFEENSGLSMPRGILLTGLPGSGKSLTAKAAASILGLPLIKGDLGTLKGSLVGESEQNMKAFCQLIDSISPCVVWLDK